MQYELQESTFTEESSSDAEVGSVVLFLLSLMHKPCVDSFTLPLLF